MYFGCCASAADLSGVSLGHGTSADHSVDKCDEGAMSDEVPERVTENCSYAYYRPPLIDSLSHACGGCALCASGPAGMVSKTRFASNTNDEGKSTLCDKTCIKVKVEKDTAVCTEEYA